MGLLGFQIRPVSGPDIADFGGLRRPKPLRNPSNMMGREAAPPFWMGFEAV
jgi:hypothetical protein